MKRQFSRVLSVVLSLIFLLGTISVPGFAAEAAPDAVEYTVSAVSYLAARRIYDATSPAADADGYVTVTEPATTVPANGDKLIPSVEVSASAESKATVIFAVFTDRVLSDAFYETKAVGTSAVTFSKEIAIQDCGAQSFAVYVLDADGKQIAQPSSFPAHNNGLAYVDVTYVNGETERIRVAEDEDVLYLKWTQERAQRNPEFHFVAQDNSVTIEEESVRYFWETGKKVTLIGADGTERVYSILPAVVRLNVVPTVADEYAFVNTGYGAQKVKFDSITAMMTSATTTVEVPAGTTQADVEVIFNGEVIDKKTVTLSGIEGTCTFTADGTERTLHLCWDASEPTIYNVTRNFVKPDRSFYLRANGMALKIQHDATTTVREDSFVLNSGANLAKVGINTEVIIGTTPLANDASTLAIVTTNAEMGNREISASGVEALTGSWMMGNESGEWMRFVPTADGTVYVRATQADVKQDSYVWNEITNADGTLKDGWYEVENAKVGSTWVRLFAKDFTAGETVVIPTQALDEDEYNYFVSQLDPEKYALTEFCEGTLPALKKKIGDEWITYDDEYDAGKCLYTRMLNMYNTGVAGGYNAFVLISFAEKPESGKDEFYDPTEPNANKLDLWYTTNLAITYPEEQWETSANTVNGSIYTGGIYRAPLCNLTQATVDNAAHTFEIIVPYGTEIVNLDAEDFNGNKIACAPVDILGANGFATAEITVGETQYTGTVKWAEFDASKMSADAPLLYDLRYYVAGKEKLADNGAWYYSIPTRLTLNAENDLVYGTGNVVDSITGQLVYPEGQWFTGESYAKSNYTTVNNGAHISRLHIAGESFASWVDAGYLADKYALDGATMLVEHYQDATSTLVSPRYTFRAAKDGYVIAAYVNRQFLNGWSLLSDVDIKTLSKSTNTDAATTGKEYAYFTPMGAYNYVYVKKVEAGEEIFINETSVKKDCPPIVLVATEDMLAPTVHKLFYKLGNGEAVEIEMPAGERDVIVRVPYSTEEIRLEAEVSGICDVQIGAPITLDYTNPMGSVTVSVYDSIEGNTEYYTVYFEMDFESVDAPNLDTLTYTIGNYEAQKIVFDAAATEITIPVAYTSETIDVQATITGVGRAIVSDVITNVDLQTGTETRTVTVALCNVKGEIEKTYTVVFTMNIESATPPVMGTISYKIGDGEAVEVDVQQGMAMVQVPWNSTDISVQATLASGNGSFEYSTPVQLSYANSCADATVVMKNVKGETVETYTITFMWPQEYYLASATVTTTQSRFYSDALEMLNGAVVNFEGVDSIVTVPRGTGSVSFNVTDKSGNTSDLKTVTMDALIEAANVTIDGRKYEVHFKFDEEYPTIYNYDNNYSYDGVNRIALQYGDQSDVLINGKKTNLPDGAKLSAQTFANGATKPALDKDLLVIGTYANQGQSHLSNFNWKETDHADGMTFNVSAPATVYVLSVARGYVGSENLETAGFVANGTINGYPLYARHYNAGDLVSIPTEPVTQAEIDAYNASSAVKEGTKYIFVDDTNKDLPVADSATGKAGYYGLGKAVLFNVDADGNPVSAVRGSSRQNDRPYHYTRAQSTIFYVEFDGDNTNTDGNITWSLDNAGCLTICGNGDMNDYNYCEAPWYAYSDAITSVVIEDGVTSIGYGAFYNCEALQAFVVDADNRYYCAKDGNLFSKDMITLVAYAVGNARTAYEIPQSVTTIGDYAFYSCEALESITIPSSVISIGDEAFYDCSALTDVYYNGTQAQWNALVSGVLGRTFTVHYLGEMGEPIITMTVTEVEADVFELCAERRVPEAYTVVQNGIVYGYIGNDYGLTEESESVTLDNYNGKSVSQYQNKNGQYTVRVQMTDARKSKPGSWYASSFLTYKDANEAVYTIYSPKTLIWDKSGAPELVTATVTTVKEKPAGKSKGVDAYLDVTAVTDQVLTLTDDLVIEVPRATEKVDFTVTNKAGTTSETVSVTMDAPSKVTSVIVDGYTYDITVKFDNPTIYGFAAPQQYEKSERLAIQFGDLRTDPVIDARATNALEKTKLSAQTFTGVKKPTSNENLVVIAASTTVNGMVHMATSIFNWMYKTTNDGMTFKLSEAGVVFAKSLARGNVGWPSIEALGWHVVGTIEGQNLYAKHFNAGETVQIPTEPITQAELDAYSAALNNDTKYARITAENKGLLDAAGMINNTQVGNAIQWNVNKETGALEARVYSYDNKGEIEKRAYSYTRDTTKQTYYVVFGAQDPMQFEKLSYKIANGDANELAFINNEATVELPYGVESVSLQATHTGLGYVEYDKKELALSAENPSGSIKATVKSIDGTVIDEYIVNFVWGDLVLSWEAGILPTGKLKTQGQGPANRRNLYADGLYGVADAKGEVTIDPANTNVNFTVPYGVETISLNAGAPIDLFNAENHAATTTVTLAGVEYTVNVAWAPYAYDASNAEMPLLYDLEYFVEGKTSLWTTDRYYAIPKNLVLDEEHDLVLGEGDLKGADGLDREKITLEVKAGNWYTIESHNNVNLTSTNKGSQVNRHHLAPTAFESWVTSGDLEDKYALNGATSIIADYSDVVANGAVRYKFKTAVDGYVIVASRVQNIALTAADGWTRLEGNTMVFTNASTGDQGDQLKMPPIIDGVEWTNAATSYAMNFGNCNYIYIKKVAANEAVEIKESTVSSQYPPVVIVATEDMINERTEAAEPIASAPSSVSDWEDIEDANVLAMVDDEVYAIMSTYGTSIFAQVSGADLQPHEKVMAVLFAKGKGLQDFWAAISQVGSGNLVADGIVLGMQIANADADGAYDMHVALHKDMAPGEYKIAVLAESVAHETWFKFFDSSKIKDAYNTIVSAAKNGQTDAEFMDLEHWCTLADWYVQLAAERQAFVRANVLANAAVRELPMMNLLNENFETLGAIIDQAIALEALNAGADYATLHMLWDYVLPQADAQSEDIVAYAASLYHTGTLNVDGMDTVLAAVTGQAFADATTLQAAFAQSVFTQMFENPYNAERIYAVVERYIAAGMLSGLRADVDGEIIAMLIGEPFADYAEFVEKANAMAQSNGRSATVSVSSVTALDGSEIMLEISLDDCAGFADLGLEIGYDTSVFTLIEVAQVLDQGSFTTAELLGAQPYNLGWTSVDDISYNGVLATLKFSIAEGTAVGDYPITVSYYKGRDGDYVDGEDVNYAADYSPITMTYVNGTVTVRNHVPGDITGEGVVNNKDATRLLRYLAGWKNLEVDPFALDVNGDGSVNNKDATRLLRYLAGWNVEIY